MKKYILTLTFGFILYCSFSQTYSSSTVAKLRAEKKESELQQRIQDSLAAYKQYATDDSLRLANLISVTSIHEFAIATADYNDILGFMDGSDADETEIQIRLSVNKKALKNILLVSAVNMEKDEDVKALESSQQIWEKYKTQMMDLNERQIQESGSGSYRTIARLAKENELIEKRVSELCAIAFPYDNDWQTVLTKLIADMQGVPECEQNQKGIITVSNLSGDPYDLYDRGGNYLSTVQGREKKTFYAQLGETTIKAVQKSGYLLYATEYLRTARLNSVCQEFELKIGN